MAVKTRFWDPEIVSRSAELRSPFNRGNRYKEYENKFCVS